VPAQLVFPYHRSIAPTLGVLLGLAIVETLVLHVVAVALWGWRVAIGLGLFDLSAVVWLIALLRAIRRHPVTLTDGLLTMRLGTLRKIEVPLSAIAGLRAHWTAESVKKRDVLNLALANYPNVVVDLAEPVRTGRRTVRAVAHKLDDPAAFASALAAIVQERAAPTGDSHQ
jgi:hypothetical protein